LLAAFEPTFDLGIHRPRGRTSLFVRHDLAVCARASGRQRTELHAGVLEPLSVPGVKRRRITAALYDVVGCAEETKMEVIVMWIARLTAHHCESLYGRGGLAV
jgi:hypothetical protein